MGLAFLINGLFESRDLRQMPPIVARFAQPPEYTDIPLRPSLI